MVVGRSSDEMRFKKLVFMRGGGYKQICLGTGNVLATENQQAIINDVIDIKMGLYLHKA